MTPPVFAHGHLRLYLLSLLEERPMHGYELIQALEARFGGTYSPSAGTIYPRLAKLEEEGLVTRVADGRKSVYEITDAGRAEVEARRDELVGVEAGVTDSVRRLADDVRSSMDTAMRSLRAELALAARDARAAAVDVGLISGDGAGGGAESGAAGTGPTEHSSVGAGVAAEAHRASAPSSSAHRASAPSSSAPARSGERAAGRRRLEEAELLLATFRTEMRAELHARFATTDTFGSMALEEVRAALDAADDRIRAALRADPSSMPPRTG
jgi:DNA-binding PadR family transcriptional regulator